MWGLLCSQLPQWVRPNDAESSTAAAEGEEVEKEKQVETGKDCVLLVNYSAPAAAGSVDTTLLPSELKERVGHTLLMLPKVIFVCPTPAEESVLPPNEGVW